MTRRRFWLLVHRVNGLLLAGFLTVVGLTGSLLAWRLPLERFFAPSLFALPHYGANTGRADPVLVREFVQRAYPWADVDMLDLNTKPDRPLEFTLAPKANATGTPSRDDEAYADPYSGRVLGSRRDADLHQGWKNAVPFVYALHESLALGQTGTTLLGVAALLWTFDCFVGLYLTLPARHSGLGLLRSQLTRAWPRRFAPAWLIRWQQGSFKRLYDVHRAFGLWLWLMLLIFAWTGVVFNLPFVAQPVLRIFGAASEVSTPQNTCLQSSGPASLESWRFALRDARERMAYESTPQHFVVREERFLSYDRASCVWTYRVRSTRDVDRIGNTQVRWRTGSSETVFSAPTGMTQADTVTTWLEAVHEAQIGGTSLRLLVSLSGVVTCLLSVTGVWIYLRKRRSTSLYRTDRPR